MLLSVHSVLLQEHGVSSEFHLARQTLVYLVIYPDMCKKTEGQVYSAAESSLGYTEMQNGYDANIKYEEDILPHSTILS